MNALPSFYSATGTRRGSGRRIPHLSRLSSGLRTGRLHGLVAAAGSSRSLIRTRSKRMPTGERIGQRVFDEFDTAQFRTDDPEAINALRDRERLKTSRVTMSPNGQFPIFRWVVEARGRVRLTLLECAGCHLKMEPDGTFRRGMAGNLRVEPTAFRIMLANLLVRSDDTSAPLPPGEQNYIQFGVPWLKDDIHARFRTMPALEISRLAQWHSWHIRAVQRQPLLHHEDPRPERGEGSALPRRHRDPSKSGAGRYRPLRRPRVSGGRRRDRTASLP